MTAADDAYVYTKKRILDGRYAGGELISEGDVATGVGMSRTPVREAFLRLESESLLRLYPRRGALVVPVSAAEVESVIETRLLVERFAVEKVVRLNFDLSADLDAAIAHQEGLAVPEQAAEFVEADREFHRVFVAATGNRILVQLHDSLRDRQDRMGLAALARSPVRTIEILKEHRAIAAALAAYDGELASTLVERHLERTLELLRSVQLHGAMRVST